MAEDDIPVLTGNSADDEFAIGAGTGAKITPNVVSYTPTGDLGGTAGTTLVETVLNGKTPVISITATGHPTAGTWATDQAVIDANGNVWSCTAGGTPGTWVEGASGSTFTPTGDLGGTSGSTIVETVKSGLTPLTSNNNLSDVANAATARGNLGAAPTASPTFTGTVTIPTPTGGDNSTKAASTAFVDTAISGLAPTASPTFTGTVTVPTPTGGDNTTKAASTAFVETAISGLAPLASPALTGSPTAPTQTTGDNSTKVATTAFVSTAVNAATGTGGGASLDGNAAHIQMDSTASASVNGSALAAASDHRHASDTTRAAVANNLSDLPSAETARGNLHVTELATAQAVIASNVSLSGLQSSTITDGSTLTSGDIVLCIAQTTQTQNGPWVMTSGTWSRPLDFPTALTFRNRNIMVSQGNNYGGAVFQCLNETTQTVGTSTLTFAAAQATSSLPAADLVVNPSAFQQLNNTDTDAGTTFSDIDANLYSLAQAIQTGAITRMIQQADGSWVAVSGTEWVSKGTYQGAYSTTGTYAANDLVTQGGAMYTLKPSVAPLTSPGAFNAADWSVVPMVIGDDIASE